MNQLPEALAPLAAYNQFILWVLTDRDGKQVKLPVDYRNLQVCNAHDPAIWLSADAALLLAQPPYGMGFVFTPNDPFFFIDVDSCLTPTGWSATAHEIISALPGAAVEVSQSGRGLHIIGSGKCPPHSCKNIASGLELYTENRFAALTGTQAQGSAGTDCTAALTPLVEKYFSPSAASTTPLEWTSAPCAEWKGIIDDTELIVRACASTSAGAAFGGRASFKELWEADPVALGAAYPDPSGIRPYDASSADAALAQHLAFWTGRDCERIRRLMNLSALRREKWEREDYLPRTILRACGLQRGVYGQQQSAPAAVGIPPLRSGSKAQRSYAEKIREAKLAVATPEQKAVLTDHSITAKFWIDNQDKSLADMCAMRTPAPVVAAVTAPQLVAGYQYLTASMQLEHFKGCVYVQSLNKIFTPDGQLLKAEQFNATYGGYSFQLDESGDKTTRKAWEAFTESQIARYPKAAAPCFRPRLPTGAIIMEEGRALVNTYYPVITERTPGDPSPFLSHLSKMLPVLGDQQILLSYMAACVQHVGVKFQWAPLLQGTEGNGKTLFTRCVAAALGHRYTHMPPSNEVSEKFNEWLFFKLFIGIEDVYVADNKRELIEILKPMITNDRLAMRAMQQSQIMGDNCANFMLNSNHRDAIQKTRNDRRFCIFYTAQQCAADLVRDGMTGDYFPRLYEWLNNGGYAIITDYLHTYPIPPNLNPATICHRAPETTTTKDAVLSGLGVVEQEILEAIDEGRPGFAGGWVSSVALDKLLNGMRLSRAVAPNKRRDLMQSLGYDWHPGLRDGRVNNPIMIDDGKKPRLFITEKHSSRNISSPVEIAQEYQKAQGALISDAKNIFK